MDETGYTQFDDKLAKAEQILENDRLREALLAEREKNDKLYAEKEVQKIVYAVRKWLLIALFAIVFSYAAYYFQHITGVPLQKL